MFQCLPNEKEELEREHRLSREGSLVKIPRDFTDSKHLIENEQFRDEVLSQSSEKPPPTETDF